MLAPPSPKTAFYYPVTTSVSLAAIALYVMDCFGQPANGLFMNSMVWERWQVWRALTCTLPHANFLHLAFNLYWFWTFGTLIERVYGHFRFAGIILLLAFGSSLAQFAFLEGGIGLSGVGYGLWGMLWVLEKYDARFMDAVDQRTSQLFVAWFFLCILLTVTGALPVGNIAHGIGALSGVLLGLAICGGTSVRWRSIVGLTAVIALGFLGSTVFWPKANFSDDTEAEVEQAGLTELKSGNAARGVKVLEFATQMKHTPARAWYNLGVAYERAGRYEDSARAFEHAAMMPDADYAMQNMGKKLKDFKAESATNR